jgi:hypothetical protein
MEKVRWLLAAQHTKRKLTLPRKVTTKWWLEEQGKPTKLTVGNQSPTVNWPGMERNWRNRGTAVRH